MESSPSPLSAFLYLLMRDHLPSGRVKEMIVEAQQAKSFSAPELAALAERYAAYLSPPPSEEPAPKSATPRAPSRDARPAVVAALEDMQTWASVADLVDITSLHPQSIRMHLREMVASGKVEAQGKTRGRRYKLAGKQVADAQSDNGRQPERQRPAPKPTQSSESDVELMARVGDFINQADGRVYPIEIETAFSISGERRRTIIAMLLERHRIQQIGNPPHITYAARDRSANSFRVGEEAGGDRLHLKTPEVEAAPPPDLEPELVVKFTTWAFGQRTFKRRHAMEAFPDLDPALIGRLCLHLANSDILESRGEGGGVHYAVKAEYLKRAAPRDSLGRTIPRLDGGTLEGQVLAALDSGSEPLTFIVTRVGAPEEDVKRVLDKLVTEDNVRINHVNGDTHYVTV